MFNTCARCGSYHADKTIDPAGPYAICPECGYRHPFRQLPLFVITGASGAGKSSVCTELAQHTDDVVVMESDILWQNEYASQGPDYRHYREMWLRVCKNISQAGKPVVLCGCAVPEQFEPCVERRYFGALHYLALVCDDDVLAARLKARPQWRSSGDEENIHNHVQFNQWLKENAERTAIQLLDTTGIGLGVTTDAVLKWIREKQTRVGQM